jgi:hypothetical protein
MPPSSPRFAHNLPPPIPLQVSRGERAVWVDQWCRGARQLSQWDHLAEYARATDSVTLSLDCMWRLTDWQGLHQTLQNVQVMSQIEETPQVGAAGLLLLCACLVLPGASGRCGGCGGPFLGVYFPRQLLLTQAPPLPRSYLCHCNQHRLSQLDLLTPH